MKLTPFPAGVFPDILSHQGETWIVYAEVGKGLTARAFPDGAPTGQEVPLWTIPISEGIDKGWARLYADAPQLSPMVAYSRTLQSNDTGAVTSICDAGDGLDLVSWEVESDGGPSCWGPEGRFSVQDRLQRVLTSFYPAEPSTVLRQGNAGGISRFDGDQIVLVTEESLNLPHWTLDGSAVVSQAHEGGVLMTIGDQTGIINPGQVTAAPRVTRQQNGLYAIAWWVFDSHGATAVMVATDVSVDDLEEPEPPEIKVEPYAKPKAIGVIYGSDDQYGYHQSAGNCEVLFDDFTQMVTKRPVISSRGARHVPLEFHLGTWSDKAADDGGIGPEFRYHDGRHYEDRWPFEHDVVRLFQCYPTKGEPPDAFLGSMWRELDRFTGRKMIVLKVYPGNPPEVFTEAELEPYFPVYDTLLRRPDVDGALFFDHARSGLKYHPRWLAWYEAFAQASPGLPDFSIQEPPPPQPIPPSLPPPEEIPVPALPPIISLRRKSGFVNIDPANGNARENAPAVAADERFEPQQNIGPEKKTAFRHRASGKLFSVDSFGQISSKTALGPDEQADVVRGRYALFYNEFQGLAQVAAAFVICDEAGTPLPLR